VAIAARECYSQNSANFTLEIYDLFGNITNASHTQVAWLSNFTERNIDWQKLKHKQYNDLLNTLDSFGRVREMMKQYHSAQQRKTQAMKKPGDLWQH